MNNDKMTLKRSLAGTLAALPLSLLSALPSQAQSLYLDVYNNTSSTITEIYLSPNYVDDWEDNILTGTVGPGDVAEIDVVDGLSTCTYDIYVVYADGGDYREDDVDLCKRRSITVSD